MNVVISCYDWLILGQINMEEFFIAYIGDNQRENNIVVSILIKKRKTEFDVIENFTLQDISAAFVDCR